MANHQPNFVNIFFARCALQEINIKVIGLFIIGISAQLAIWIIFIIITITMLKGSRKAIISQKNSTRMKELQKNVRVSLYTVSIVWTTLDICVVCTFYSISSQHWQNNFVHSWSH